ncbi:Amidase [Bradyrhizobium sp. Gha]|nr:Amidase [Bradyrhizobium sp. Gha]
MTLTEVARAIGMKQVSSHEVTRALLHRIAQWQPHLNAFMSVESEAALNAADAADAELAKGGLRGPLHGVPLAHKDMYYDAGKVATCGSLIRRDFVPTVTSTALQRLKDAGQIRLGTLHLAEFAYGPTGHNAHYGPVRNPWNVAHITGGSSSGSGASVAARLTFAALGSDTGGSIRMPAHFCGVTGLKTTWSRVSRAGAMPLSQSLDTVGPLARTAEDCALLLALMAGPDPEDSTSSHEPLSDYVGATRASLKGLKIGVPASFYVDDLDSEVARVLDETIAVLKREGADIVKVELPDQRQLSSAQPARARSRGCRLPQALDDRTAAGLRFADADAAPERPRGSRRHLSRGDALAWPGTRGAQCGRRRCRRDHRTGIARPRADDRGERRRRRPERTGAVATADAVHPSGEFSGLALADDALRLHQKRPACWHAADRSLLR